VYFQHTATQVMLLHLTTAILLRLRSGCDVKVPIAIKVPVRLEITGAFHTSTANINIIDGDIVTATLTA
jgi:hypothetical protein